MTTFGWKNFDSEFEKKFAGLYQNCYPLKIKYMLLINPPWYLSTMMAIVKLFIKKKLADKIKCVWTKKAKGKKLLYNHVERHQIPPGLGGTLSTTMEVSE